MNKSMLWSASAAMACFAPVASAQFTQDQLTIAVNVDVTPQAGGIFLYEYTLTNAADSQQSLEGFILVVDARSQAKIVGAPEGWTFGTYASRPLVGWAATEGITGSELEVRPSPASPFQLSPGRSLSGFKLQSPFPAGTTTFFAQGYVQIPVVDDVEDLPPEAFGDFTERAFSGSTIGPVSPNATRCGPEGGDSDADGVCERADNCRFIENPGQEDRGGLASGTNPGGTTPDGVGAVCQCGDNNNDGRVTSADVQTLRVALLGSGTQLPGVFKCNLAGPFSDDGASVDCDLQDVVILSRAVRSGRPIEAMQACRAARP